MSISRNNQENLIAKMQEAFKEYIKEDDKEPMYAICRIRWLDDGSGYDVKIKLSVGVKPETDDDTFFYCDGIKDLKSLTTPGGEDFIITGFYHFE